MQIHELPTGTLGDSDYAAIDNGTNNRKLSLKSAINSLITAGVAAIQSALTTAQNNITALQNSMATANTNIGALQTKVGSASTSNVGDGSLAGAVGNTVMGTTATTLSGAIKEHEDQIGATDISNIGDGTITGAIGDTDISDVGDGTLTGAIAVETGTFLKIETVTLNAQTTLHRVGNMVIFNIDASTSAAIPAGSSGTGFIVFPAGFRPATAKFFSGRVASGTVGEYFLSSNGQLQVNPQITSGQTFRLSGSFIV